LIDLKKKYGNLESGLYNGLNFFAYRQLEYFDYYSPREGSTFSDIKFIISLAHVPVHVTDFPIVSVHVDVLSSARIWQHKLCATFSANVKINYRLPIKVYYRICTLRHIRIEINHGSQNVF
jgi:hypothetical protein